MPDEPNLPKLTINAVTVYDATEWFPTMPGRSGVVFHQRRIADIDTFAVHHDAVAFKDLDRNFNGTTLDEERARMQASYNWHTRWRDTAPPADVDVGGWNWPGMGYHLYAFPSGRIYLVGDLATIRAHVAHRNTRSIGLVFAGEFMRTPPADGLLLAGGSALLYCWGFLGRLLDPKAHRQLAVPGWETSCCGDTYASWVPSLLDVAAAIARNNQQVNAETRIRVALTPNWEALNLRGLDAQIHYLLGLAPPAPR